MNESKLKAAAMDSVGERTEFTPAIINKRFPDSFIPENAKVTAVKIGDKVATCVEELPVGYLHLPTKPIEISVKYVRAQKYAAWNDADTKPDHPCLCETKTRLGDGAIQIGFQYWTGKYWAFACGAKDQAMAHSDYHESLLVEIIQWREVQP